MKYLSPSILNLEEIVRQLEKYESNVENRLLVVRDAIECIEHAITFLKDAQNV